VSCRSFFDVRFRSKKYAGHIFRTESEALAERPAEEGLEGQEPRGTRRVEDLKSPAILQAKARRLMAEGHARLADEGLRQFVHERAGWRCEYYRPPYGMKNTWRRLRDSNPV
jgi:hypothetical protein